MQIDFEKLPELKIQNMNGGTGTISARMFADANGKIMLSRIPAGASIGEHTHTTSSEVNYILQGNGVQVCGGEEEPLSAGGCWYCPQGQTHGIRNTGTDELILYTVVAEK
ncbi:MAG: cupin domain-containing protein [Methanocorpusculum sp.]|nr:cupin domain-containing protein [Methanocorpusculum sp.]